ncbi:uncharacterized protein HMPREF1541_00296 [Cyphellophora europaea CBS 101466]|uniref:Hyaluronan/mRNA-binding protein domain-containing protein n=1 Tax=Cyphellophora europaea (strain CBS 101466) TaxID=1220924 RepID=W2SBM9_CYPE1|nr:uncharacterized protein HMPREF1541_00296 [Cyphellophora europaea CBS 101466]ETN46112.1 hypothetical protein HMPREF1541_00296 [Cyphellophora europaea CBS 101466]
MTRSSKANDRNHAGLADGSALPEDRLPRYFAKSGFSDADPSSIKKHGGGRGNWGREGIEAEDLGYNINNIRRRSNSSTQALGDFKTKFEVNEADPVFEEELHGPTEEDVEKASMVSLDKEDSTDSSRSVDGEDAAHKKM